MEQLTLVDHYEWWITYEDRLDPLVHGIRAKHFNEATARDSLASWRERGADRFIFEVQRVAVHRTAEKLDW